MALTIDINANTKAAQAQVKDLGKSLDSVSDSLDDLAADATKSGNKTEKALDGLGDAAKASGRDIEKTGDKLEATFRDLIKDAKKAEAAVDDIGDAGAKGFGKLGDKGAEVSGELRQNLGETFSSFRGDLEDLPQIAQDTLGGLAGSGALGGIGGLAATAAGAAGLGLIIAAMEQIDARAEELRERANTMAQAFIDAGSNVLSATSIAAASADVLTDEDKRKKAQEYADALGIDLPTAIRAYVGDANAMKVVDAQAAKAKEENLAIAEAQKESVTALTTEQQKALETNQKALGAQRELRGVVADANSTFESQQKVLKGLINDASEATKEVDDLGNAVYTLPDGTQILIDAKTGQATTDISKFKGDLDGIPEVITSRVKVQVDTSAWDNWRPSLKYGAVATTRTGNQIWD